MSISRRAGKRMALGELDTAPGPRSSHPAQGYLDFGVPNLGPDIKLAPESTTAASAGLGREYLPSAEGMRSNPGNTILAYGGGYLDTGLPNGYVDRARLEAGLHYVWTDEFTEMPISALPFHETGKPGDSSYGTFLHFKQRLAMNGAWWAVIKGLSRNTGVVAQTRPEPLNGRAQQPDPRFGQAPWGPPPFVLEVPRPSTKPRTVPAISVMPS